MASSIMGRAVNNMRCLILLLAGLVTCAMGSSSRDLFAMSKWAEQQGIVMHESLEWKRYNDDPLDEDSNWGLELKEPVPPGTTLLQVPRNLVLDADSIGEEFQVRDGQEKLSLALEQLGDFGIHKEGFFIFLKLLRCSKESEDSQWAPWIQALPKKFPDFTTAEKECLPFYAKYAADYQDNKFQAFCHAAAALGELKESDPLDMETAKWAFHAVGSRCWKTAPINKDDGEAPNTELVPVGDMFNHREPPNVAITHDGGSINFVYKGNDNNDEDNKNLYITYGQPSNPHRFLAIFGFVPNDMTHVWSHLAYPDNPFSADASKMVVRASDGMVPKIVWDAILYALLQPQGETPVFTEEQHTKYKKFTSNVLKTHVTTLLDELAALRLKMDTTTDGERMDLIRQHNEFLTTVFSRVRDHLENGTCEV